MTPYSFRYFYKLHVNKSTEPLNELLQFFSACCFLLFLSLDLDHASWLLYVPCGRADSF